MSIKEKFERGIYSLKCIPRILYMDTTGIYINKNGLYPNEVESLEDMDWERDKHLTHKLKATSYGDWQFNIGMINTKHFENREKLDNMFIEKSKQAVSYTCINVERISIEKAVKLFNIEFSCNMDWYLNNQNAIEMDLNHKILHLDSNNEYFMKKLNKCVNYLEKMKMITINQKMMIQFMKTVLF
jgi:hypothetical protein